MQDCDAFSKLSLCQESFIEQPIDGNKLVPLILFSFSFSTHTKNAFFSANHRSYLTPATVNMAVFKKDSPNSQHRVV